MSAYPFGGKLPASGIRACRRCGCTEHDACIDELTGRPCHWVEPDLCSACDGLDDYDAPPAQEQPRPAMFSGPPGPVAMALTGTVISLAAIICALGAPPL